jgi:hypothetical protein
MFWNKKETMTFDRKLNPQEKDTILHIVEHNLSITDMLLLDEFLDGRRHMRRYPKGHKKVKKARPALSNHTENC